MCNMWQTTLEKDKKECDCVTFVHLYGQISPRRLFLFLFSSIMIWLGISVQVNSTVLLDEYGSFSEGDYEMQRGFPRQNLPDLIDEEIVKKNRNDEKIDIKNHQDRCCENDKLPNARYTLKRNKQLDALFNLTPLDGKLQIDLPKENHQYSDGYWKVLSSNAFMAIDKVEKAREDYAGRPLFPDCQLSIYLFNAEKKKWDRRVFSLKKKSSGYIKRVLRGRACETHGFAQLKKTTPLPVPDEIPANHESPASFVNPDTPQETAEPSYVGWKIADHRGQKEKTKEPNPVQTAITIELKVESSPVQIRSSQEAEGFSEGWRIIGTAVQPGTEKLLDEIQKKRL